jgi:hypothetical protein
VNARQTRTLLRLSLLAGLAVLVALLLPTTGHGDFFISNFNSALIFTDHPNFYRAVGDEPSAVFPTGLSGGPYGPLFYYPTALWLWLLDLLHVVNIDAWDGTGDPALRSPGALLGLKLPYLAVYALVAVVLARMFGEARVRGAGAWLWLTNPAVIVFSLMMGQNDGWTALASVLALYFGLRAIDRRPFHVRGRELPAAPLAMLCLAAGAAVKLSPIFLVPAFAWLLGEHLRSKLLLCGIAVGAFVLTIAPFLGTDYFWEHGLLADQPGKTTAVPTWAAVLMYVGYLALVWRSSLDIGTRRWALVFCFVAFHAFFFIAGGWSPQRAVLFIAALAIATELQPWLVVPYALTTAMSLFLALEHRNEIAIGLFEPLSSRFLLIPSLLDGTTEPWHTLLFVVTAIAWLGGLALLRAQRATTVRGLPVALVVSASIASLVAYIALSGVLIGRGVDLAPYPQRAGAQQVEAGDTFSFAFISPQDDLRSISFHVQSKVAQAVVRVTDEQGTTTYAISSNERLHPDKNTIGVPRARDAKGRWFVVTITPEDEATFAMASVPSSLSFTGAELNGKPLDGTALFSAHYQTTWNTLADDVADQLRDHWHVVLVRIMCCLAVFAAVAALEVGTSTLSLRRQGS